MKEYLPIGSVILLDNGEKKLMIYGRKQIHDDTGDVFDYISCLYPEGNLGDEHTYLFNHENIKEVVFKGFVDEEESEFLKVIEAFDNSYVPAD